MMRELLKRGADYDAAETQTGWTCAHFAAYRGNDTIARILVDCGATLEYAESKCGSSPLHIASREGHDEVARVRVFVCLSLCETPHSNIVDTDTHVSWCER